MEHLFLIIYNINSPTFLTFVNNKIFKSVFQIWIICHFLAIVNFGELVNLKTYFIFIGQHYHPRRNTLLAAGPLMISQLKDTACNKNSKPEYPKISTDQSRTN